MTTTATVPARPALRVTTAAVLALVATFAVASAAPAQETVRIPVSTDSKLWIDGTSNLHGWSCKAEKFEAVIELDAAAAAQLAAAPPKALKRVEVKVPVKALKCGHGAMDNNLYKALNADQAPEVSYILATFEAAPGEAKDTFTLQTQGTLVATRLADGAVKATGVVAIKMTDYGIQPPTAIFGRLKTGDEVKVNFELTVGAKAIVDALEQR